MAAKWRVKLECGHWSDNMSADMQAAVEHDGWTDCRSCGDSVRCSEDWRYGGLTASQTRRKLNRKQEHEAFTPGAPKVHRSGMASVQVGPNAWAWWCRRCEGYDPIRKGYVRSLEQAALEFSEHRSSPMHRRYSSPEAMQAWTAEQAARAAATPTPSQPVASVTGRKRRRSAAS